MSTEKDSPPPANLRKRFASFLINLCFITVSVSLALYAFEITLKTGLLDGADNSAPVWIPPKYKELNFRINKENFKFASKNPYGFNDRVRSQIKEDGFKRIAVLGDSFVWGDGIPYEETWPHKLEKKYNDSPAKVEVISWGHNGWNTLDQLAFLKNYGLAYNIDYLVISFVTNDPDINNLPRSKDKNPILKHLLLLNLKSLFPLTVDFLSAYIERIFVYLNNTNDYGTWEKRLYTDENLRDYASVLEKLSEVCKKNNIPLLFVLCATNSSKDSESKFDRISQILEEKNIRHINMFKNVKTKLGNIPPRKLWANPANGHPGKLLTDLYSEETFKLLKSEKFLYETTATKKIKSRIKTEPSDKFKIKWLEINSISKKNSTLLFDKKNRVINLSGFVYDNKTLDLPEDMVLRFNSRDYHAYIGPGYSQKKDIGKLAKFSPALGTKNFFSFQIPTNEIEPGIHSISLLCKRSGENIYGKVLNLKIMIE